MRAKQDSHVATWKSWHVYHTLQKSCCN